MHAYIYLSKNIIGGLNIGEYHMHTYTYARILLADLILVILSIDKIYSSLIFRIRYVIFGRYIGKYTY